MPPNSVNAGDTVEYVCIAAIAAIDIAGSGHAGDGAQLR